MAEMRYDMVEDEMSRERWQLQEDLSIAQRAAVDAQQQVQVHVGGGVAPGECDLTGEWFLSVDGAGGGPVSSEYRGARFTLQPVVAGEAWRWRFDGNEYRTRMLVEQNGFWPEGEVRRAKEGAEFGALDVFSVEGSNRKGGSGEEIKLRMHGTLDGSCGAIDLGGRALCRVPANDKV